MNDSGKLTGMVENASDFEAYAYGNHTMVGVVNYSGASGRTRSKGKGS